MKIRGKIIYTVEYEYETSIGGRGTLTIRCDQAVSYPDVKEAVWDEIHKKLLLQTKTERINSCNLTESE